MDNTSSKTRSDARLLQLALRTALARGIDPLQGEGADLHELFFQLNRKVNAV